MTVPLPSPWANLIGLAVALVAARLLVLRRLRAPTAAGAAVMAVGIFGLASLDHLPFQRSRLLPWLALLLIVSWGGLVLAYVLQARKSSALFRRTDLGEQFAVGTWVAATAVLAEIVQRGVPQWRDFSLVLDCVATLLWLWFIRLALVGLGHLARQGEEARPTGTILLTTVSTQSLVLTWHAAVPRLFDLPAGAALLLLGAGFYVAGMGLLIRRYLGGKQWSLVDDWTNTNCIMHGAMSITGLAVASTRALPGDWAVPVWLWCAAGFVLVEAIELLRAVARVRQRGWREGLLTYHVTQWARNFTWGMFYAFTLAMQQRPAVYRFVAGDWTWLVPIQGAIVVAGPYVVLGLLLVETGLFLRESFGLPMRRRFT